MIRAYQIFISPMLAWLVGPGGGCRFEPSCSQYFLAAVEKHGVWRGGQLGMMRLARCHPWGGKGYDPVPEGSGAGGGSEPVAGERDTRKAGSKNG